MPRNTERLVAEVYANGSGGGCEEFWDTSAPSRTGYSCSDGLPYREIDVLIDGQVAGAALPYPQIYTGGWSNPYLWAAIPDPTAFDLEPVRYDLTPYLAKLDDGRVHRVSLVVHGLAAGATGWTLLPNFQAWQDHGASRLTGAVTLWQPGVPEVSATVRGHDDQAGSVVLDGRRQVFARGYLDTSHGRVGSQVAELLENHSEHHWTDGESHDQLDAVWTDNVGTRTYSGHRLTDSSNVQMTYKKDGYIDFTPHPGIDGAYDIKTNLKTGDFEEYIGPPGSAAFTRSDDRFVGTASWIYGVPREDRHATAKTAEIYRSDGEPGLGCYDHLLRAVNGYFVTDRKGCWPA